jgi:sulfide:quinone oxidoreductase
MRKKVVVLGANFGGLTAALSVKRELEGDVDVTVVSASDHFLFNPSLIWLPFGKRDRKDITFPVAPTFESHGIDFVHASATGIDPAAKTVTTDKHQTLSYDYLVIATGYRNKDDVVPGFRENAVTITTLPEAERAAEAWKRYLDKPGDIVVAASQGAGCFGAAYEFLFNTAHQLRKAGLRKDVKLTYVTSEPFLGHFGIGGLRHGEKMLRGFLGKQGVATRVNVGIDHIDEGAVVLADGEKLASAFTMVVPPFVGQDFLKGVDGLADAGGYVKVRDTYQTVGHDDIYAVGIAAAVGVPWQTPVPVGIPKTGFPTEMMAHIAATNIASQVRGGAPEKSKDFGEMKAVCVMDAGDSGVILLADKMLPPRKHGVLIPGPQAHVMKLGFEKYFIWKSKNGHVALP